jgi:hypothetical protein
MEGVVFPLVCSARKINNKLNKENIIYQTIRCMHEASGLLGTNKHAFLGNRPAWGGRSSSRIKE